MVQSERGHTQGNHEDNTVLIQRVLLAEDRQVEKHDGKKLAGFGEDEGKVVDMRQTGVTEGRSERRRDAHQNQWEEDPAGGEYRGDLLTLWGGEQEVCEASNRGKRGLNGVQD